MAVNDLTEELGKRIRVLRKEKTGLSQMNFANKIGLDRVYEGQIERGEYSVTITKLKMIADGLGVSMSELLKGL